ncbi:MAG: hypothetical protein ACRERC_00365 [Candidatus Binatia bacterium]
MCRSLPCPLAAALLALVVLAWRPSSATAADCAGDCDGGGSVSVAELIQGVRISLGETAVAQCPAFDGDGDGTVRIAELIRAVSAALNGCAATPTAGVASPTPTTVTDTPAPTDTPLATEPPATPTATPPDTATPSATPTMPVVDGTWREDPLIVTASTCLEAFTAQFAEELAARPACLQEVTALSEHEVQVVDCTARTLNGTLDRDGTIRLTAPTESDTVEGCTVALTTSSVIAAASSPTAARYTFDVAFFGTCPLPDCVIDASGTWTRQ